MSCRLARETKLEPVSNKTKQELLSKSMRALLFRKPEAALLPKLALNLCLFLLLPLSPEWIPYLSWLSVLGLLFIRQSSSLSLSG